MSIVTHKQIIPGVELTASLVTYHTATFGKTKISRITFTNTDTVVRTVTVHYVPNAGSADDTNIVCNQFPIGPLKSIAPYFLEGHILENGDFIRMEADVTEKVTVVGSGMEIV